jgi:gluconokinase
MVVIVMGVTGSGKTTVGRELAARMQWPYYDADDFHSAESIAKMHAGIALDDADRGPWLDRLHARIVQTISEGHSAVLACSALRHLYRQRLAAGAGVAIKFVYLRISPEIARQRLQGRPAHYMPPSLVESQFAALEEPDGTEYPASQMLTLDAVEPLPVLVARASQWLKQIP